MLYFNNNNNNNNNNIGDYNIKEDLKKGWEGMDWIHLTVDRGQ
jgi:hypothetical protein